MPSFMGGGYLNIGVGGVQRGADDGRGGCAQARPRLRAGIVEQRARAPAPAARSGCAGRASTGLWRDAPDREVERSLAADRGLRRGPRLLGHVEDAEERAPHVGAVERVDPDVHAAVLHQGAAGARLEAYARQPLLHGEEASGPEAGAAHAYAASQPSNQRSSASSTRARSAGGSFSSSW